MELLASACVGVGLAAACGARVFLPLFILALGSYLGVAEPSGSFAFVASPWAVVALGLACVLELGAYYIPVLDHALDVAGAPAATLAGTLAMAANLGDAQPLVTWGSAIIAGGGLALAVRSATSTTRAASTLTTGGLGNSIYATVENVLAAALSILALLLPIFAGVLVILSLISALLIIRHVRARRKARHEIDSLRDGELAFDLYDSIEEARAQRMNTGVAARLRAG